MVDGLALPALCMLHSPGRDGKDSDAVEGSANHYQAKN